MNVPRVAARILAAASLVSLVVAVVVRRRRAAPAPDPVPAAGEPDGGWPPATERKDL